MTTRLQVQTAILAELNDSSNQIWTAAQIQDWMIRGLREWAKYFPMVKNYALTTSAGTYDYGLTALVGQPVLTVMEIRAGSRAQTAPLLDGRDYEIREQGTDTRLWFKFDPGIGTYQVIYGGFYAEPSVDGSVLDLAVVHEQALIYYCCYRAVEWLKVKRNVRGVAPDLAYADYKKLYNEERKRWQGASSGWLIDG